ncbi:MAG: hypothetical protein V3V74_07135 [Nitrosomonadaceae bacterium]
MSMDNKDIDALLDKRQYVLSPEEFEAFKKQLTDFDPNNPNPKLVAVLKQDQSWEELFSKGKKMKKRKWYVFDEATNENNDIKEPSLEEIRSHYIQDSCVHEPDADLDCISCVMNFLIERIEELEKAKTK